MNGDFYFDDTQMEPNFVQFNVFGDALEDVWRGLGYPNQSDYIHDSIHRPEIVIARLTAL